jgi:hypothetical protein
MYDVLVVKIEESCRNSTLLILVDLQTTVPFDISSRKVSLDSLGFFRINLLIFPWFIHGDT